MNLLIAHLIGDYVIQNHWMANNKTRFWVPAIAHALLYGVSFILLGASLEQWAVIVGTHLLIDHYRLAAYWVRFWGVGESGWLLGQAMRLRGYELGECLVKDGAEPHALRWTRKGWAGSLPYISKPPPFLSVWLLIIVDNTMHLAINAAAFAWLP